MSPVGGLSGLRGNQWRSIVLQATELPGAGGGRPSGRLTRLERFPLPGVEFDGHEEGLDGIDEMKVVLGFGDLPPAGSYHE